MIKAVARLVGGVALSDEDVLSERVGRIALAQAQIDEWLVQILIELLRPLPESRVQILVGKMSLDQKTSLVRDLTKDMGWSLDLPLASGAVPSQTLKQVRTLNSARDRAVHSYYSRVEADQVRQFRSRRPVVDAISLAELRTLGDGLVKCIAALREFADTLAESAEDQLQSGSRWGEVVRGVHEVIVAGHLHEVGMLEAVSRGIRSGGSIRLALRGVKRRILRDDEVPSPEEFLAEISVNNWLATITSPNGETLQFVDSGWRDVTALAQAEDADVELAVIRRVGDSVQLSVAGGEMATAPWPQAVNRLAERAFGPIPDAGLKVPDWVRGLEGFAPTERDQQQ